MPDTNSPNGAEAMVRMLALHDVREIFGLCGDTSLPFYDALSGFGRIRHHLFRDERHAAYAADAYARLTRRVGVCEGPSGGGATHILPGVAEANDSSVALMAITTDVSTSSQGRFPLTELDQEALFRPITKRSRVVRQAGSLPREVRAAFRTATAGRPGAVHLGLPIDVQLAPVPEDEIWADVQFGAFPSLATAPNPVDLEVFLDRLLAAQDPVAVAGGGVVLAGAEGELQLLLERLNIPLCTSVSGQGALAETHPLCAGVVGSNGGVPATRRLVEEADLVLFLGCRAGSVTTERWRVPAKGTPILHIDADPNVLGANYPSEETLCADLQFALAEIHKLLDEYDDLPQFGGVRRAWAAKREKRAAFENLASSAAYPIRPEATIAWLRELLPDDAIVLADPGTPCPYFSAHFEIRQPGRTFITNRAHGALGYALGASIGAQIARPDACVVAAMGDGSFGFCVGELETLGRLGLPVKLIVFSNASFGWIKAGQKHGFGERYFSVDFDRTDHAAIAAAYGIHAARVERAENLESALRAALRHEGPALVDVISQPLEEAAAPVSEWIA